MSIIGSGGTQTQSFTEDMQQASFNLGVGLFNISLGTAFLNEIATYMTQTSGATVDSLYSVVLNGSVGQNSAYYPNYLTNAQFADRLAKNLLGTKGAVVADDAWQAGADWVKAAMDGGMTRAEAAKMAVEAVAAVPADDADYGTAVTTFNNKVAVSEYYTLTAGGSSTSITTLSGTLTNVTATTDVSSDAAIQAIVDASPAAATGQTFSLTTGIDQGAAFTGSSGGDSFSAIVNNADATKNTLNAGDSLSGGDGTDTLSVVASNAGNSNITGFYLNSVEALSVQNADTNVANAIQLDLTNAASVATIKNQASTAGVTLNNVSKIAALELNSAQDDTTVNYTATTVAGAADTQNITLNGANTTANGTVTVNGIETIAVTASGANSGSATTSTTLAGDASLKTVTVAGDKNVSLNVNLDAYASGTNTGTFNAGTATGNVTATITATLGDKLAVTGGAGNDSLTINTLGGSVTVAGGNGVDTLRTSQTNLTQTDLLNVSGVEKFSLATGSAVDVTKQAAELTNVIYAAGTGASTLTGVKSGLTVEAQAAGTSLGVTVTNAATATDDVLNLVVGKTGTVAAGGTAGLAAGTLTATGVETINLTSQGADSDVTNTNTLTIAGNSVKTVTVAGAMNATLSQAGGSITSYDASTASGKQNTASISFAAAGATVKGGSAADTLTTGAGADSIVAGAGNDTITAAAGNDTIDGGEGNDAITGGAGADVLTGGAGTDTFTYTAASESTAATLDTIKDFVSGTDKIAGTGALKFLGNYGDVATGLAAVTATGDAFFVTATNTLYVSGDGNNALNNNTDYVIKLEGVTALTAADLGLGSQGTGNSITLTAASATANLTTNTNATAKTTTLDDTINVAANYLPATAVVGGLGQDTVVVTDGTTANAVDLSNITEVEVLDLTGTNLVNTITNNHANFKTYKLGSKGDIVTIAGDNDGVSVLGGAGIDQVTLGDYTGTNKATVDGAAGNDVITVGAVAATNALTLTAGADTADKLGVTASKTAVLTGSTLSGFEILGSGSAGSAEVVTIDSAQFAMFSSFDLGANAGDQLKLSGAGTYDLTTKTVTSAMEVHVLGEGSTLRANAAQLGDASAAATGTGVGGGDTLAIANAAAFDATTVTKFDTITYAGTGTNALTVKVANLQYGADGTTIGTTGAATITGSGTSDLTISGDASIYFTGVALTGFDAIDASAITTTGNNAVFDVADLQGVTLKGHANTNLVVKVTADATSTMTLQGASQFDTLQINNAGAAGATLTIGSNAFNTSMTSILGTNGGQTESIAINASTATAAINLGAVATTTDLTAITVNDGTGNNTITVSSTEGTAAKTTVSLANGGSDTVVINDLVFAGADANGVTITGFTTGAGAGADVLDVQLDDTAAGQNYVGDYQIVTAAAQALTIANTTSLCVVEVNQAAASVTNLSDVAADGLVEAALATAFGTVTNAGSKEALVILYGAGAAAGNAGVYSVTFTGGADAIAGNLAVELVGIVNNVTADSFVSTNFA